ncbi:MAG TPA: penicillin-binding protein 2, partial [Actinomycetota bacterium]|nr:penicillin-binding protein 2 [Actinomycetota bacterium]
MNRAYGDDDRIRVRVSALGLIMLALISVLGSRLWFLQVLANDQYAAAATANYVRLVSVPAPRGKILDRNGKVLVGTRSSLTVGVRRTDLRDKDAVLNRLADLVGITREVLDKRLADKRVSPYKPVTVARDVPQETWLYLREHAAEFPGVETDVEPVRLYPEGGVAAHVIGYVGEINEKELQERRDQGYRLGDEIGRAGVERSYEHILRGKPGLEKIEVDSRGTPLRTLGSEPPVPGKDLQLTLDLEVQKVAEQSLFEGIQRARGRVFEETKQRFVAPAGGVVVLDAKTGEVVAMASYPTFDLKKFSGGIDPEYWRFLNDPVNEQPLLNRVIQSAYPPGSTFKPFVAAGALMTGQATPTARFACTTEFEYGGRIFRNWRPRNSTITLAQALIESCDTPFYRIGANWWAKERERERANNSVYEAMQDWAVKFGLGRPTNIDFGTETKGRMPGRAYKRDQWRKNRDAWCERFRATKEQAWEDLCVRGYVWRGGDSVNMSIGQGDLAVTPLQLALAYGALANGGNVMRAYVGKQAVDPETKDSSGLIEPAVMQTAGLEARYHDYIRDALV